MDRRNAAFCRRLRRRRGFWLAELLAGAAATAVLALVICTAAARCLNSWQRLQEEERLQEAARHILTAVEKELAYGAVHIDVQKLQRIMYQTTSGNKKILLYCDNGGLYQRTTTGSGSGTNPLFLENVAVEPWQVRKISDRVLELNLTLRAGRLKRSFQRFIYCCNGEVGTDE